MTRDQFIFVCGGVLVAALLATLVWIVVTS